MKKNLLSILALLCAGAALAVSIYTCISVNGLIKAQNVKIDTLLAAATEPAPQEPSRASTVSWQLEPRVWADGTGADVVFTATLDAPADATVYLDVQLNGQNVGFYPCTHNSVGYTATAALAAENGYSYTCAVTYADGTVSEYPLTSPGNPTNYQAVFLRDCLNTYCNLMVSGWELDADTLRITTAHLEVQLPQLSPAGTAVTCREARLVLLHGGSEADSQTLTLVPGEGTNALTMDGSMPEFSLPELAGGDELALWLEIELSDGRTEQVCGAEWYLENGELMLVAG